MTGYLHLRADERGASRTPDTDARPGLRVACLASGKVWWFPSPTPELGMVLARAALYEATLTHPRTEIAFGEKRGPGWNETQVLKAAEGGG